MIYYKGFKPFFSRPKFAAPVTIDESTYLVNEDGYLYSAQLIFSDTALLLIAHNFWWY